jgi:hypothetical protein
VENTLALILFLLFIALVLYIFSAERPVPQSGNGGHVGSGVST